MDEKVPVFRFPEVVDRFGEHPAIVRIENIIRYREFAQQVAEIAAELKHHQVKNGEQVAIIGPNSAEYLILLMALWQINAVAVPVSTRLPEEQCASLLKNIGCRKLIPLSKLPNPQTQNPELKIHYSILDPGFLKIRNPQSAIRNKNIFLTRDATIIFTSGSSGEPKAALHTFGNHIYSALGSNMNIPFQPGDRWLLSLPLYHVGGLAIFFRALVGGGAVAVPNGKLPLVETIRKLKITHISLVAAQLFRLLREDKNGDSLSNLKAILLGGSAIPPSLVQTAIERRLPIHTSYGSTEMSSQVTTTPPGAPVNKLLTSGKVLKYREIKIAPGGEILLRGKTRFRGYREGDSLVRPFDAQGWFPSGDIGKFDEDGYLMVLGRKDNMFISGGENIQPEEIERQLSLMDGIEQAVVVPLANKEFGMRPVAFIKMQTGKPMNETAIRSFLEKRIARFKIPDRFFPWPETAPETGIKMDRKYFQKIAREEIRGKD